MLKIEKGSKGIMVNVNHNSALPVLFILDTNNAVPLIDNSYFVIDETMTSTLGLHVVKFVTQDANTYLPSKDRYTFEVI
jgi:hypothetical protein